MTTTVVQILDSSLNHVADIKSLVPIDKAGNIVQYSKELSDFGQCKFRVSTYDPSIAALGDIVQPHRFHVRIMRGGVNVWQGAIVQNARRNKDFIEVTAVEYVWYLGKILINRTATDPNDSTSKTNIFRIFNSGTMAAAVTALMNETIAKYSGTGHALSSMTLGTIENPNYPPNMTNGTSPATSLTGPWSFGNGVAAPMLTYDFHSVLYVLKSFGAYTHADFNIDSSLRFNFKSFLGSNKRYDVNFVFDRQGNVADFNITRLGQRQANILWGVAVDSGGRFLIQSQSDQASVTTNGILEDVVTYTDIKDQATLNARVLAELPFLSTASGSADTFVLNETSYPLGVYDIGDIITARVNHVGVTYNQVMRIVGITVNLHNTGTELTHVQLNTPQPWQYGAV